MDILVCNSDFRPLTIIDAYESLIWTDRYDKWGDFELYMAISGMFPDYIKQDYYLISTESDHVMIVEKISINTDPEDGTHTTITGRSLESILDRRIIWGRKSIEGSLQDGIKTLLRENIISPSDSSRRISNFIFEASTDPAITGLTIDAQYTGDNLYDIITKICAERGIGFKITLNDSNQFVFKLYSGVDRSYNQTKHPYVVFSPNFDNLLNSNYVESKSALKNITLVAGEGEGPDRKFETVGNTSVTGLNRRELFTDARDISSDLGDGRVLSASEYSAKLTQRGNEKLAENAEVSSFEGEAETTTMFRYGEHFFMGDIVQVANEHGHETSARVVELVQSTDVEGTTTYPTFKSIEKGA